MTLARRFLLANLAILLASMAVVGAWVGAQIEAGVLDHTASTAAAYVDSMLTPRLEILAREPRLDDAGVAELDGLLGAALREQRVVAFKVWSTDGTVLYSPNRALIGRRYPVDADLARSVGGAVTANVSDLTEPENEFERQQWSRLLQVYAPVRASADGRVVAVTEFYQPPDQLDADIAAARARSWPVVGGVTAVAYLLLAGIVKRGSDTIVRQERLLCRQLAELAALHGRLRQAAARTTALNEQALRRISADLHDGPGQALALALLRLDALRGRPGCPACGPVAGDFAVVEGAVRDALADVRAISASLRSPQLEPLRVLEVAARAVRDHERRTGARVELHHAGVPEQAPLATKIALLRTLQEALSNATRHGGDGPVTVALGASGGCWT